VNIEMIFGSHSKMKCTYLKQKLTFFSIFCLNIQSLAWVSNIPTVSLHESMEQKAFDKLPLSNFYPHPKRTQLHLSSQNDDQNEEDDPHKNRIKSVGKTLLGLAVVGQAFGLPLIGGPLPANALSDEQRIVADAWRVVNRAYVDNTFNGQDWQAVRLSSVKKNFKNREDAYKTIRSMLALLDDPYTRFLTPADFDSLYSSAKGDVAGVGLELQTEDGAKGMTRVSIVNVVENSPAARAGFKRGDFITNIDGTPIDGKTAEIAAAMTRGNPGTPVSISVDRPGVAEIRANIVRQELKLQGMVANLKETTKGTKIGNIKIKFFSKETLQDVTAAIKNLKTQGAQVFVLDLRHCPGGYFPAGIDVARLFLPTEKTVVYVLDRNGISDYYETVIDGLEIEKPLYVLVDEKTASASEILTGALKDNDRATLVGKKTFGKARVQTLTQLEDGSGLAVTVSRYETPLKIDINKVGIPVDVESDCGPDDDILICLESVSI